MNVDEKEPCWQCDGDGCETCNDTGLLYTDEAIRLQIEAEENDLNDWGAGAEGPDPAPGPPVQSAVAPS